MRNTFEEHAIPPSTTLAAVERNATNPALAHALPIPRYLETVYWWAYVHPKAVHLFEREWLVNAILFGHYATLRNHALAALGALGTPGSPIHGRTLQVACVYGNLTASLLARLAPAAQLEVVDVLPIQLKNLRADRKSVV